MKKLNYTRGNKKEIHRFYLKFRIIFIINKDIELNPSCKCMNIISMTNMFIVTGMISMLIFLALLITTLSKPNGQKELFLRFNELSFSSEPN